MQLEADERHQGRLSDNILTVFNMLTVGEKRTFLRHAIRLTNFEQLNRSIRGASSVIIEKELIVDTEDIDNERSALQSDEKEEHEKFVNFLTRLFFTFLIVFFVIFCLFVIFYGTDNPFSEILPRLNQVLEVLLKF